MCRAVSRFPASKRSVPSSVLGQSNVLVDHLIVKLRGTVAPDPARFNAVIQRVTAKLTANDSQGQLGIAHGLYAKRIMSGGTTLLSLGKKLPVADANSLAQTVAADPDVEYAEPDRRLFARTIPSDPDYAQQWNLFDSSVGIDLPAAWDLTLGSPSVVTAVIDTGYRPHADFIANLLPGYDFITDVDTGNNGRGRGPDATDPGDWVTEQESNDSSGPFYGCVPADSSWHGTLTTGLIGAIGNNGIGMAGVNWFSKILPIRVLGKCGGSTSDIVDAMRWAAGISVAGVPDNPTPAKILNLSLGGPGACSQTFQQAINEVTGKGVTVVVAAGNDGVGDGMDSPANCAGVIAVGATDSTGHRAYYSNYGATVTLSAPGSNILSTSNAGATTPGIDSFAVYTGTSFAAPQVSGIIGLMLSANPRLTPLQIAQKLIATARPSKIPDTSPTACSEMAPGAGLVDARAAVAAASN